MKISVVVPFYNEDASAADLLKQLFSVDYAPQGLAEVICVNDGSTDRTASVLNSVSTSDGRCKVVHLSRNMGQTAALMAGISYATGDVIVTMDGDLQNDPKDIPGLLARIAEGYDVVSGWRRSRQDPWLTRVMPSRIANMFISLISGVKLRDYGCTLKAYRRSVLKNVRLYGEMHRFIPIYATWEGARVVEVPVTHHPRTRGKSKYGISRTIKVVLDLLVVKFLASYSQKPIYVFGSFGLLNFALSLLCVGGMIYFKFWGGKSFIQTPLPQLVILFVLMGFVSLLMGLIAEIQMRTYYESQGKTVYLVRETRNIETTPT
jgi:glycosyltransferase involved in cell wall biosynthesis